MHPPTFAAGTRLPFAETPDAVKAWVGRVLGGTIVGAVDKQGGFSPGAAAVVTTDCGASGFVKAVGTSINAESVAFHRAENAVAARIPPAETIVRPVASESLQIDGDEWEVMIFPVIEGETARHPWSAADIERVLDAVVRLGDQFTPSPWPRDEARERKLASFFRGWSRVQRDVEVPWASHPWIRPRLDALVASEAAFDERLRGDTLSHCDLRADNVLLSGDRVWFVDWAHAGNAARWLDPVLLLCDFIASGADRADGGETDLYEVLLAHKAFAAADESVVWTIVAGLAATLHWLSRQPSPPRLPTIRAYQDVTAEALLRYVIRHNPEGPPRLVHVR